MTDFSEDHVAPAGPMTVTELSSPAGRGRPTELDDAQLRNRREQLLQGFEGYWGEMGLELQRCKKEDDLIHILQPLTEAYLGSIIRVFCHPSTQSPSAPVVREIRSKLRTITESARDAQNARDQASERLRRVADVMAQATEENHRTVQQEHEKRLREQMKTESRYQQLHKNESDLKAQLQIAEASFARQQIFQFLKSKRYEITPLSLANAAAGLPYMGWRQSMRRCQPAARIAAEGLDYQIFKLIRYMVNQYSVPKYERTVEGLVSHLQEKIRAAPRRYRLPQGKLAEEWFYLERALQQIFKANPHPKECPFEITSRYFKQRRSPSSVDRVLADIARLILEKPSRNSTQNNSS